MAYTKQTWVDGAGGLTPLNATRLNYIEDGLQGVSDDLVQAQAEAGLLGYAYRAATVTYDATASWADVDATNLTATFVVPASGQVVILQSAWAKVTNKMFWGARNGSTLVIGRPVRLGGEGLVQCRQVVGGLTPGSTLSFKWAFKVNTVGTDQRIYCDGDGTDYGYALMEIRAA